MKKITLNSKELALLNKISENSTTNLTTIFQGNLCISDGENSVVIPIPTENLYHLPILKWGKEIYIDEQGNLYNGGLIQEKATDDSPHFLMDVIAPCKEVLFSFKYTPLFNQFISKDKISLTMSGVNVNLELGEIATTDGYILCTQPIKKISYINESFMIPNINYPIYDIDVYESNSTTNPYKYILIYKMENIHYITSCITEAFPDYKKVIDKKGETKYSITINIEKFLQFTKKLNNYKNNVISFEEDSEVRFMDNDFEVYEKDVFTFQGAFQRIGFNWKMLNDLLKILKKATKSEQVTLNLTTPTEPAFMCEQDLQILVMPMLIPLENQ